MLQNELSLENIKDLDSLPEEKVLQYLMVLLSKLNYSISITPHRKEIKLITAAGQILRTFSMDSLTDLKSIKAVIRWLEWKINEPK